MVKLMVKVILWAKLAEERVMVYVLEAIKEYGQQTFF
jgi:hypothetical protein